MLNKIKLIVKALTAPLGSSYQQTVEGLAPARRCDRRPNGRITCVTREEIVKYRCGYRSAAAATARDRPSVLTETIDLNTEVTIINEGWFELLASRKRSLRLSSSGEKTRRLISIFGGSDFYRGSKRWRDAFEVGRELARRGAVVFNGGYGGVMEASAAGARSEGGTVVGVTCDNLPESEPNRYLSEEWRVERWDQRLISLVWLADGYVIMPGSSGTLVELAMVIETQLKGFIPARPVVCLGRFWESIVRRIEGSDWRIMFAKSPEECAAILVKPSGPA